MAATARVDASQHHPAHALYAQYYPSVYRYALSQLRSAQDAEDAAQNTFLRAFAALQRGVVPQNESAWLFKIAHNVCASSKLAWLRRRRVEAPRDLAALAVEPAAREAQRDELFGLEDALASMPPRLREAFLLREWQGLSYDEIAARLDTSRSAVETLLFRARRALAAQLDAPWEKVRQALGLGPLVNMVRALFQGGSPVAKVAAVAVLAGGTAVGAHTIRQHPPPPASGGTPPVRQPTTNGVGGHAASRPRTATPAVAKRRAREPSAGATAGAASRSAPPAAAPAAEPPAAAPALPAASAPPAPQLPAPSVPVPPLLAPLPAVPPPPEPPALPTVPAVPQLPQLPQAPAAPPLP